MSAEIDVRLVPRSRQSRLEVQTDGTLRAWVYAPPVEGQANAALIELMAKRLSVPRASVSIVRGETSRTKRMRIDGIELSELWKRLS